MIFIIKKMEIKLIENNCFGFALTCGEFDDAQESYIAIILPFFTIRFGRD